MRNDTKIIHAGIIISIQDVEVMINRVPPIINNIPDTDTVNIQIICSYALSRSVEGMPNVAAPSTYDKKIHQEKQTPAIMTKKNACNSVIVANGITIKAVQQTNSNVLSIFLICLTTKSQISFRITIIIHVFYIISLLYKFIYLYV